MKLRFTSLVAAAVLAIAAASLNVQAHAQTAQLTIMGSSAQYYEAAQADFAAKGCFYIDNGKDTNIVDQRGTGANAVNVTDHDAFWVAWTPSSGTNPNGCLNIGSTTVYDFYMNADSVLGLRCFFASPSCKVTLVPPSGGFACGSTPSSINCTTIPTALSGVIANIPIDVAATDIRPEDGMFATLRALTPCGQPIGGSTSQYLGVGDQTSDANQGNPVTGAGWTVGGQNLSTLFSNSTGSFNVANFAISGTDPASGATIANGTGNGWQVFQVGAAPELVIVDVKDAAGLGSLAVTNINRNTLAGFLDGTFGAVSDIFPQTFSSSGEIGTNVVLREYLSGTYNTMEYAVPNAVEIKSSQEVGLAAVSANTAGVPFPQYNCATNTALGQQTFGGNSNTVAPYNPLQETDGHGNVTGTRSRAIGTGNVVKAVNAITDGLGYAFWSESNFTPTGSNNLKYLTVDGVDPIEEVWQDGEIPTTANNLESNVSFSHVKDGSYPIWSILRLVTSGSSTACGGQSCATLVGNLTTAEEKFVTPDFPDFVLKDQLSVVRSHFSPPGVTYPAGAACNGDAGSAESGGDVGGVVYSQQADNDAAADSASTCGILGQRQ